VTVEGASADLDFPGNDDVEPVARFTFAEHRVPGWEVDRM
jgi:hypothetical protein